MDDDLYPKDWLDKLRYAAAVHEAELDTEFSIMSLYGGSGSFSQSSHDMLNSITNEAAAQYLLDEITEEQYLEILNKAGKITDEQLIEIVKQAQPKEDSDENK